MRRLIFLISLLGCVLASRADYLVFEENGKVGLKDEQGTVLLPPSFQALGWSDGNFSVIGQVTGYKLGDNWGLINLKKEFITKADYESLVYPGGDRVIARKRTGPTAIRYGCLDLSGKVLVPFQYDGIRINGLRAVVFLKNGLRFEHGLIDLDNNLKIPLHFKNIYSIGRLRYAVENFENKTALFSDQGAQLTGFTIDSISQFHKGMAVIFQNLRQGLVDGEGQIVAEPIYREVKVDDDGNIKTRTLDEWKQLKGENRELRQFKADDISPLGENLYEFSISGKSGIVNDQFEIKVQAVYDDLSPLQSGLLVAKNKGKQALVHADETQALPFQFDSLIWDGKFIRAKETVNGKSGWSLYDTFGIRKTDRQYDAIRSFNGKFFPVKSKGYWGGLNRYGEEFIHCVFDSLVELRENQLVVLFQQQYGIIDFGERWLALPQPHPLKLVQEDEYLELQPAMTFVKKFSGEVIYFTDNPIQLQEYYFLETLPDGTEKQVSLNGQEISRSSVLTAEKVGVVHEGLQGIRRDGRFGFVDDKGRLRIANRYEDIGEFSEGLAAVRILGRWGFINKEDNLAVNPSFEALSNFEQGLAVVKRNGMMGVIDKEGDFIINVRYDSVARLPHHTFLIVHNGRQGLADDRGKVIVEPEYEEVTDFGNGYIRLKRNGKYGLVTKEGLSTIPLLYDELRYEPGKDYYLVKKQAEWKPLRTGL